MEPRCHPMHHYRQTVAMGYTPLDGEQVADIVTQMLEESLGPQIGRPFSVAMLDGSAITMAIHI